MGEENKGAAEGAAPDYPRGGLDYYEVDLRDYLRVLWRGKWIILATMAVAVGIAALVAFRSPDIYEASFVLSVTRLPRLPDFFSPPTTNEIVERAKDHTLLVSSLGSEDKARWFAEHVKFKAEKDLVTITLEGPMPPEDLIAMLEAVSTGIKDDYARALKEAADLRLTEIALRIKTLEAQISEWQDVMDKAYREALGQREEIRKKIDELRADPSLLELEVGLERRNLEGALAEKELDLLFARLLPVERLIDEVDRLGILYFGQLSGRYVNAKVELLSLQEEKAILQQLYDTSVLRIVRGPNGSWKPVGPNRKMNIAVAGVLGLFVGVLGAFAWNYLREGGD